MKANLLFLAILLFTFSINATTFQVGPTRTYVSPNALYNANALNDGDTIEIDFATYSGIAALANWNKNDLVIIGVGGKPHMVANGQNIGEKSIWITSGNNITIDNIEFSGATVPDENGAGIRAEGIDLTIRNCYFHDNENGILTSSPNAGHLLIEYSEFDNNGFGDGFTHNLYVNHIQKLTFRYNYSHHTNVGHNLKSRAEENIIIYNRIMDETTGNSSRLIDLPNGGFSIVMGNLLMQGNNAINNNLVGYGLEGLTNASSEFYFINNTLVNKRTASCLFISLQSGTSLAQIINNIFAGSGTLLNGTATSMSNNIVEPNIANILFEDEANYNYKIAENSPVINAGTTVQDVNGYSLTPSQVYNHPLNVADRTIVDAIDVGAYENEGVLSIDDVYFLTIKIYPNPTLDIINIKNTHSIKSIDIIDLGGKTVKKYTNIPSTLSLGFLENGLYLVKVLDINNNVETFKLIKQ